MYGVVADGDLSWWKKVGKPPFFPGQRVTRIKLLLWNKIRGVSDLSCHPCANGLAANDATSSSVVSPGEQR
jgi:hypothetical protein